MSAVLGRAVLGSAVLGSAGGGGPEAVSVPLLAASPAVVAPALYSPNVYLPLATFPLAPQTPAIGSGMALGMISHPATLSAVSVRSTGSVVVPALSSTPTVEALALVPTVDLPALAASVAVYAPAFAADLALGLVDSPGSAIAPAVEAIFPLPLVAALPALGGIEIDAYVYVALVESGASFAALPFLVERPRGDNASATLTADGVRSGRVVARGRSAIVTTTTSGRRGSITGGH